MAEQRKTRFRAGIPAVVHYRGRDYPCQAHDLSRTGVMLLGGIPWPSDETVDFRLKAPSGDLYLELSGRVARVSEDGVGDGTALALEFGQLSSEDQQGLEAILQRVIEGHSPALLSGIQPDRPVSEIRKALENITLPHRISLAARATTTQEREILRNDIHPQVLDALARNPNLLETELHGLLKSIHLLPRTLEQVADDGRWKRKPEILAEVAVHIRTPLPLAERLLQGLPKPTLRRLILKPGLNSTLLDRILKLTR